MTVSELLALSSSAVGELRRRGVVRTGNAPLGDYAEWLAVRALGGQLAANSERSFDFTTGDGHKVQVKARRVADPPSRGQLQTSPFRTWGFDEALFVLVDEATFAVRRASLVPVAVVEALATYRSHVNGSIAFMTEDLMAHPEATDITAQMRAAAENEPSAQPTTDVSTSPHRGAPPSRPSEVRRSDQGEIASGAPEGHSVDLDWVSLTSGGIDEFKQWRVQSGATGASSAAYASGARAFVQFCRSTGQDPRHSADLFYEHLIQKGVLSSGSIADYRSHARAFSRFLVSRIR